MKTLIKKDYLHYLKLGTVFFVLFVVAISGFMYIISYDDIEVNVIKQSLHGSVVFSALTVITMVTLMIILSSFGDEKKEKIIIVLLANNFDPVRIWLSKLITAFSIGYVSFLLSTLLTEISVYVKWGFWMVLSVQESIMMFFMMPIISLAFCGLVWLALWVTKNIGMYLIGLIPFATYMFGMYFCLLIAKYNITINFWLAFIVLAVALGIIAFISFVIKKISYEYLSNIHQ
jgi:hypothetical protein